MIHVFKTSVETRQDIGKLTSRLNGLLKQAKWNFDLDDCDRILRVDGTMDLVHPVIRLLQDMGYDCEELG